MKNFVCWDRARLNNVLDPDALQLSEPLFLATHVRRKIRRVDPKNSRLDLGELEPEALLRQFLDPTAPHVQDIVLGTNGSGKSRLIRWLAVHIPETEGRRVILLQKSGTNLRGVLEAILDGMVGPRFDTYRERLRQATSAADPRTASDDLFYQIATVTGETSTYANEEISDEDLRETREILMEQLPALFSDHVFRRKMREQTKIIAKLVKHAIGQEAPGQERERSGERYAFQEGDLDVSGWDMTENELNKDARNLFRKLRSDPRWRCDTANWITRNLDHALSRLLNFSQDDLSAMLLDVRRSLHEQGRELVLLIEDFAKLQGVDGALLDAISVRPNNQLGGQLCRLRSIMAITTGPYLGIAQGFSGRVDFAVDVDPLADAGAADPVNDPDLPRIAAYHMNALRIPEGEVEQWSRAAIAAARNGDPPLPIFNACHACPNKTQCHAAFGAVKTPEGEDLGLYPFTRPALKEMYRRTRDVGPFNPRLVLARLLRQPLTSYTDELQRGQWPPMSLVLDFGRPEMPPPLYRQLVNQSTPDVAPRYEALFELYGSSDRLSGIRSDIFGAFDLPQLGGQVAEPENEGKVNEDQTEETLPIRPTLPPAVQGHLADLDDWGNGGPMAQALMNYVRGVLYPHAKERIEWNVLFLGETAHTNTRGFTRVSLNFEGQNLGLGTAGISLVVPRSTSIGIQAAVLFDYHQNWDFDASGIYMPEFVELIGRLADEAAGKLRNHNGPKPYDPVPALVELLAVNALLCGAVAGRDESALLPIVLAEKAPQRNMDRLVGQPGRTLCDMLYRDHGPFRSLLMAQISCAKGPNTESPAMIDAGRLLPALQKVAAKWQPSAALAQSPMGDYQRMADVHLRMVERLHGLLKEETATLQLQLEEINRHIGTEASSQKTREAVRAAADTARMEGVWRNTAGMSRDFFDEAVNNVKVGTLDRLRAKAEKETLDEPRNIPTVFTPELRDEVGKGVRFIEASDGFLRATYVEVEVRIGGLVGIYGGDAAALKDIAGDLESILSDLKAVQGALGGLGDGADSAASGGTK